jgi:signal transduction histidine kinase
MLLSARGAFWRSPNLRRPLGIVFLFNGLLFLWLVIKPGRQSIGVVDVTAFLGPLLGTLIAFQGQPWLRSRWQREAPPSGPAPLLLGLAAFSLACGQAIWAYNELVLHQISPFPSLADVGFLGAYPFILLGILTLPTRPIPAVARARILLDSLMILAAAVTFSWYFILGPDVLQGGQPLVTTIVSCAYPLSDLALLVCLLLLTATAGEFAHDPVVQILGLSLATIVVTDSIYDYQLLHGTYTPGQLLVVGWPLGYTLVGVGAFAVRRRAASAPVAPVHSGMQRATGQLAHVSSWRIWLPYALVPAMGVLVGYVWQVPGPHYLRMGVALGCLVLLGLILLRQLLALLENRQLHHRLEAAYQETLAARDAQEQARIAAEELARLRSDFVATVSHELRTPLATIIGSAELLRARWAEMDDGRRLAGLGRIMAAANRQQRLVEDLLLLAQVEAGRSERISEASTVASLVQQAVIEVRESYGDQRIDLAGPDGQSVWADAARTVQIMVNLLDNAAKYSPERSPIAVSWGQEGEMVVVRVRDHGPGIPQHTQGRVQLFTRFGRIPGSRMRAGRVGTGLGLYLSRQLARAMGGEVDLEATGPEGSTFRLRLPALPRPGAGEQSSAQ